MNSVQNDTNIIFENKIPLYNSLTYSDALTKTILTFPIYYKIFQEYYMKGKDVSKDLNILYKPIYTGLLEYYSEFMTSGIEKIVESINSEYKPELPYAIIDYIEYVYGNILYQTFLEEINKLNKSILSYEHLCVFEYIIKVELYKYNLYIQIINKLEPNSKFVLVMENRIEGCYKKIAFVMGYLYNNISNQQNIIPICENLITQSGLESKIKSINISGIKSFISINKK